MSYIRFNYFLRTLYYLVCDASWGNACYCIVIEWERWDFPGIISEFDDDLLWDDSMISSLSILSSSSELSSYSECASRPCSSKVYLFEGKLYFACSLTIFDWHGILFLEIFIFPSWRIKTFFCLLLLSYIKWLFAISGSRSSSSISIAPFASRGRP